MDVGLQTDKMLHRNTCEPSQIKPFLLLERRQSIVWEFISFKIASAVYWAERK